jgi:putative glutamine amidotransferase
MTKKIIGCTEPSAFTLDVLTAIETFFSANPLKLSQNDEEDIHHWVDQCDAVILAGGTDIHPRTYGYGVLNDFNFSRFDVPRDMREIRIIKRCLEKNIPMFGICRGHQILGIFHGLDFIPDLSHSVVCHQPNYQKISHLKNEPMHWVALTANASKEFEVRDEVAAELFAGCSKDSRYLWVNSFHHQALIHGKTTPQGVKVLGTSPGIEKENIVEMMMGTTAQWLSVQWHPEYDWEQNAASHMAFTRFLEMIDRKESAPALRKARRKAKVGKNPPSRTTT